MKSDWREARRRSAHEAILDAAWSLVSEAGLAGLSMRDLARQAGITTPTVYAYFESKNAIYDAMFGQAASEFEIIMAAPYEGDDPRDILVASAHRFSEYCNSSSTRYELLFQRTLPGFEPTPESYAPAVRALAGARERLARSGITDPRNVDLWTALISGLVDQQISNDPGGDRWTRLIDESIDMFLQHFQTNSRPPNPSAKAPHDKRISK